MIIALDTDVMVHWAVRGARHHRRVRGWIDERLDADERFGLTQQVAFELLHVVTDGRRFEEPLEMGAAVDFVRRLWTSREVVRIPARVDVVPRLCELIEHHGLGRKRILDTALAATLEAAGVRTLATCNARHYRSFGFLEVIDPTGGRA